MNSAILLRRLGALLLFVVSSVQAGAQTALPEATPNDPGYQDAIARQMNLPAAWAKALSMESSLPTITAGRPAILVLDGAIDCTNRDLRDVCIPELNRDFTTDNNYNDGAYDHGTAVASKIAGGWNNAFQAAPILPTNRLFLIGGKVISFTTSTGNDDWVRAGLNYAIYLKTALHINVIGINLSEGARGPDGSPQATEKIYVELAKHDILLGLAVPPNSSPGSLDGGNLAFVSLVPKYPNTFAVVPLLADGQSLAPTYPWGVKTVGFAAPGQNINQAAAGVDNPNVSASGIGSSVALPETLGVAAFVVVYRQVSPTMALYRVKATSRKTPAMDGKIGYGIPDAYAALTADFKAPTTGLSLATEPDSPLAVALDSVTLQRSPLPITNPHNLSADSRGRVMFFSFTGDALAASHLAVEFKDLAGTTITAPVEYRVGVPSHPDLIQITVRIPDGVTAGDYWVTLVNGTVRSNTALVSFR